MSVGFCEAVNLRDIEPERFDFGECRRSRGGASGEDFDHVVKAAAFCFARVHQHVEHDGRATEMRDLFIGDGVVDRLGRDVAAADERAADQGHHPRMVPSVAVKQRYDLHESRMQHHAPADHRPHGHQIRAPVMINDTLGSSSRTRCVVEREAFPLILRHDPVKGRIAFLHQCFVGLMAT